MGNAEKNKPLISVIICTYNRCESLSSALQSLKRMYVPPDLDWELLVIDNNSRDKTSETIRSFVQDGIALPLKYVFEATPGLSCARNRGIRESRGEIIAFLDDDIVVSMQWLAEVKKAFELYDAACIGGRVLLHESSPRPSWWDKRYDVAAGEFDRGTEAIVDNSEETLIGIGANIIFRRAAFDRCGLFRTDMGRNAGQLTTGEETDMVQRLRKGKERVMYFPDALVYHCVPAQRFSKGYLRQHFYNSGRWYFLKELEIPESSKRILGVPKWRYRIALRKTRNSLVYLFRRRESEFFSEQLHLAFFLGYFKAAREFKRAHSEAAGSIPAAPTRVQQQNRAQEETGELVGKRETRDDGI